MKNREWFNKYDFFKAVIMFKSALVDKHSIDAGYFRCFNMVSFDNLLAIRCLFLIETPVVAEDLKLSLLVALVAWFRVVILKFYKLGHTACLFL